MENTEKIDIGYLDGLLAALDTAKEAEQSAREHRIDIESKVIGLLGAREEGSKTTNAINYKVCITGKLSREVDWEAYDRAVASISLPANMLPVKQIRNLDMAKLKKIEKDYPKIYTEISNCITVTPQKTQVVCKRLKAEEV